MENNDVELHVENQTLGQDQPAWLGNLRTFFQSLSPRNVFAIVAALVLIVGLVGGVVLSLTNQENRSHASGTVTLQVDPTPQVDLAKRTVTFLIRLLPSGDTPPAVAAVKLHMQLDSKGPIESAIATRPGGGGVNQELLRFLSFSLHDPKVFPLESDNPAGIPPFSSSSSVTPSVSPCPTGMGVADSRVTNIPCRYPTPSATPIPCGDKGTCPAGYTCRYLGVVGNKGYCVQAPSVTPPSATVTPCPAGKRGIPCANPLPTRVLGVQDVAVSGKATSVGISVTGTDKDRMPPSPVDGLGKHLYYSVGDLYAKTVSHPATLADLAFTIVVPGTGPLTQTDVNALVQKVKDGSITISFASDTEVYGLNPNGDAKNPFVKIPFISEPATFTWASIFHTPTPTLAPCPSGVPCKAPTPTPCPTGGVKLPCKVPTPSLPVRNVTLQMILACIDLQKPMSDQTSNYNSAACKAYPNRAEADLNHDGYVNGIDLNLFYREGSQAPQK